MLSRIAKMLGADPVIGKLLAVLVIGGVANLLSGSGWRVLTNAMMCSTALGLIVEWALSRHARSLDDSEPLSHQLRFFARLALPASMTLGLAVGVQYTPDGTKLGEIWDKAIQVLLTVVVFVALLEAAGWLEAFLMGIAKRTPSKQDDQLVKLSFRCIRVFLIAGFVLYVATVVSGRNAAWFGGTALGLGGLALVVAFKDVWNNLLGAVVVVFDRPFEVGDLVRIEEHQGTVHDLGMVSTELRTAEGNRVVVPNSRFLTQTVDNVSSRNMIRRDLDLTVHTNASPTSAEHVVAAIEQLLQQDDLREPIHPMVAGVEHAPRLTVKGVNDSAYRIGITYWYAPPVELEYQRHVQQVNLRLVEGLERFGGNVNLHSDP